MFLNAFDCPQQGPSILLVSKVVHPEDASRGALGVRPSRLHPGGVSGRVHPSMLHPGAVHLGGA